MEKIKETVKKMIENNIGSFIFIPGFCLILYIWFTQGEPILESLRQMGLFTTILPFSLSILSWIFGIMGNCGRKLVIQAKYMILSYTFCGMATWIYILDMDLKIRNHDISAIRDLAAYYSCVSLFVWMVTIWINVLSYKKMKKNDKKEKD